MYVDGTMFIFYLVRWMQPKDDLQNACMMFDHIKCVQGWMTMACLVYDLFYCKVVTIMVCDMQSKDTKSSMNFVVEVNQNCWKIKVGYVHFQGVHGIWCVNKLECCSHCLWDWKSYSKNGWQRADVCFPLDLVFRQTYQIVDCS